MNEFDYKESLTNIKASLFDIYEDQEKIIGDLDDSIRDQYVNSFIEVKDLALTLLEKIQGLYQFSIDMEESDEEKIPSELSSNVPSDQDEEVVEEEVTSTDITEEQEVEDGEVQVEEEPSLDFSLDDQNNEAQSIELSDDEEEIESDKKFHLLCNEKDLNFAYVPENLLEKLKKYKDEEDDISFDEDSSLEDDESFEDQEEFDSSLDTDNSKVYKKDKLPAKGIIVRNDQYMKLALSKHRQEGVLEEAKQYRIDTIKKKRQEEQKIELEKAKVHLDI